MPKPYAVPKQQITQQVAVNGGGIVRIHGIPVFRRVVRSDGVYIQFKDRNRWRSACRGTDVVEVTLSELVEVLT